MWRTKNEEDLALSRNSRVGCIAMMRPFLDGTPRDSRKEMIEGQGLQTDRDLLGTFAGIVESVGSH